MVPIVRLSGGKSRFCSAVGKGPITWFFANVQDHFAAFRWPEAISSRRKNNIPARGPGSGTQQPLLTFPSPLLLTNSVAAPLRLLSIRDQWTAYNYFFYRV